MSPSVLGLKLQLILLSHYGSDHQTLSLRQRRCQWELSLNTSPRGQVKRRHKRDKCGNRGIEKTRQTGCCIELRGVRMFDKPLSPLMKDIRPVPFFYLSHHSLTAAILSLFVCLIFSEANIWYASRRKIRADTDWCAANVCSCFIQWVLIYQKLWSFCALLAQHSITHGDQNNQHHR